MRPTLLKSSRNIKSFHFTATLRLAYFMILWKLSREVNDFSINIKSYISYSQDYEQQVAGVGQLVSKLSTETTNSTNDLETRLLVGFLELSKQHLFLRLDCRFFGLSYLRNLERISYSSDCSWKPHGFSRANFVGEGGRGENVSRKGGFRNLEIGEKVCRHL